jgi:hypothetical protein
MQGDKEEAEKINKYLSLQEHNLLGQPIFRIVFADDQFEMREGDYNEFYRDLFVRSVHGIKKTPKYPGLKGLWILEQWFDASRVQSDSIKDHNGYECLYAFRNPRNFEPLPLRLRVVELILKAKRTRSNRMLFKTRVMQVLADKEAQEDKYVYDAIDPSSPIESALHFREGVSLAGLEIPNEKSDVSYASKSGK